MINLHPKDILRHKESDTIVSYEDISDSGLTTAQIENEFEVIHYAWRKGTNVPDGLVDIQNTPSTDGVQRVYMPDANVDLNAVNRFRPVVDNPFHFRPNIYFDSMPTMQEQHWEEMVDFTYTDSASIGREERETKLESHSFSIPLKNGANTEVGHKLANPTDDYEVVAVSHSQLVLESPNGFTVREKLDLEWHEYEVKISGFRMRVERKGITIDESRLDTLRALDFDYLAVDDDERVWAYVHEPELDCTEYMWQEQDYMLEVTNIVNDIDIESWETSKQEI